MEDHRQGRRALQDNTMPSQMDVIVHDIFLVGPPAHSAHAVCAIAKAAIEQSVLQSLRDFRARVSHGPILYLSKWAPRGELKVRRPGQAGLFLWRLNAEWRGADLPESSAAILVVPPVDELSFEPFAVICPGGTGVRPGRVFEWRTRRPDGIREWGNRAGWLPPCAFVSQDSPEMLQRLENEAKQQLLCATKAWGPMTKFKGCFPNSDPTRGSRKQQRGNPKNRNLGSRAVNGIRLEQEFPWGLPQFLAAAAPRPATFELLARTLWLEDEGLALPPTVLELAQPDCAIPLSQISSKNHLAEWWWAGVVNTAGQAVQRHVQQAQASSANWQPAVVVRGFSGRTRKLLGAAPGQRLHVGEVLRGGHNITEQMHEIRIGCPSDRRGSDGLSVVRGVSGIALFNSVDMKDADEEYTVSRHNRLLLVRWMADGVYAGGRSIHFVARSDVAKQSLLFEREVLVRHASGQHVSVVAFLGPWVGHGPHFFKLVGDRSSATVAAQQPPIYSIPNGMANRFISPADFQRPLDVTGGIYGAFGGPGVGKTSEKLMEALHAHAGQGHFQIIASPLSQVRNVHVSMLKVTLGDDLFKERVRVMGHTGLDELARSRTLTAIVWGEMEGAVIQYEASVVEALEAMGRIACLERKSAQLGCAAVAGMVDEYAGFWRDLSRLHGIIAASRCALEEKVKDVETDIKLRTTTLVTTTGAIHRQACPRDIGLEGSASLRLFAIDEASLETKFSADMALVNLRRWVTPDTVFAVAADPAQNCKTATTVQRLQHLLANFDVAQTLAHYILATLAAAELTPDEFIAKLDLLNRYRPSLRCPPAAASLVTSLAPHCLPGPVAFWKTEWAGNQSGQTWNLAAHTAQWMRSGMQLVLKS